MPKGRPRLTLKKKRTNQARVRLGRDKDAPTADEWAIMHQYRTFQVSDEDRNEFDFSIDDFARVLPNKREVGEPIETYEYWVCRILDVRAKDVTDVWVQVEWLYSAREAAGIDRKFKASHCGKYERLKSNHVDYVSSSVFDGLVQVKHYDETALDQEPIGADEFYYRYTVDIIKKSISPIPRATCVCGSLDNLTTPVMHFCPQPACRKYYHSSCIVSPSTTAFRDRLDFLLADPDTGAPLQLPLNESASAGPPTKRRRASHAAIPSPNPMGLGPPSLRRSRRRSYEPRRNPSCAEASLASQVTSRR
ncbi:BAH domain-containing protein [Mycena venus]|uniref:BAH domain-containing protein n=1 Tax=Mycena venus TaxID=2733690 RepID=A0A8H7DF78_9AGAR|nr:BAH domain-containing protein [Mycena venus]